MAGRVYHIIDRICVGASRAIYDDGTEQVRLKVRCRIENKKCRTCYTDATQKRSRVDTLHSTRQENQDTSVTFLVSSNDALKNYIRMTVGPQIIIQKRSFLATTKITLKQGIEGRSLLDPLRVRPTACPLLPNHGCC